MYTIIFIFLLVLSVTVFSAHLSKYEHQSPGLVLEIIDKNDTKVLKLVHSVSLYYIAIGIINKEIIWIIKKSISVICE